MGMPGLVREVSLGPGLYPQLMPVDYRQGSALPATQLFACANMTECNMDCGEPGCAATSDAVERDGFVLCFQRARLDIPPAHTDLDQLLGFDARE